MAQVVDRAGRAAEAASQQAVMGSHIAQKAVNEKKGLMDYAGGLFGSLNKVVGVLGVVGLFVPMLSGMKRLQGSRVLEKVTHTVNLSNATPATLKENVGNLIGHKHGITESVGRFSTAFAEKAQKMTSNFRWGQKAFDTLKHNQIMSTLVSTGFVIGGATSLIKDKYDDARTLQQMQYDLTGQKVSKDDAKKSDKLDAVILRVREKEVTGLKAKIATGLRLVGVAGGIGTTAFMSDGTKETIEAGKNPTKFNLGTLKFGVIGAAVTMGPNFAASLINRKDALHAYHDMYVSCAKTGHISKELYEGFFGGMGSGASSKTIDALTLKAYNAQLQPKQALELVKELSANKGEIKEVPDMQRKPGKFEMQEMARRQQTAANDDRFRMKA